MTPTLRRLTWLPASTFVLVVNNDVFCCHAGKIFGKFAAKRFKTQPGTTLRKCFADDTVLLSFNCACYVATVCFEMAAPF